ncbi:hypothetical protein CR513_13616, partial [Mucuna pruriens]
MSLSFLIVFFFLRPLLCCSPSSVLVPLVLVMTFCLVMINCFLRLLNVYFLGIQESKRMMRMNDKNIVLESNHTMDFCSYSFLKIYIGPQGTSGWVESAIGNK